MQPYTKNWTQVTEFVMMGFAGIHEAHLLFFILFLTMYLFTLVENLAIILVVGLDHRLRRPMYFFLTHLSCLEIWYTSVTVPKMLAGFIGVDGGKNISYADCLSQLFIFTFLGATECFLLAAMAYDRYVAICMPLHYGAFVSWGTCIRLAAACWLVGFLTPILPIYLLSQLTFYGPNVIDHFSCDASPLLALSCSDVTWKETVDFLVSLAVLLASSMVIAVSYGNIVWTLLHIRSAAERWKAFSTCAAHLTVVSLFYGTLFFMYVQTKVTSSINFNKVVSVFYSVVTPMLNPLIYSLRNKEVKGALGRVFSLNFWKGQ
ncbi:olfactory receptor family 6 subfamily Q member 1 [Homo sapiens]|uniref:Olfactory receptor 6Q1 n=2 Tax=Homo sapiens TaxID=9606 RepID=OR6Q1_HUMAN|nr:olfactory receptor 6Q1 [Homo sapiens]Q8NGQ2.2 RecName: Full=Olfactory receptor 6Q1; AltName: Full=Olfactory receptor OR11-226 [Homo sapiens]ALI87478.1 OR6Q1 [Homo sapiens]EAW73795.1 olfactory receptor, family 6, subfamily Q, member 1 [Homo sapiens]KAI4071395.1 olfactory receptor family 6 subfamily Q member 1 [Homo sapiens]|eukprot:NP_001005186.2 olfactory receptor 6Q1 [Homo sapiens]